MAVNYFRIKASDIRGNKWQLARISPTAQKYNFKFPMKALHTISNITMGQSPLGNTYNDKKQGLPFYQGKTLFSNKYILEPKTWTTDPKKIAYHNDILISVRAPVGSVNLCSLPEICIGRGLGAIRASKEANQEYLFYILLIFTNLIKGNHGATFEMIASDELANSLIPLPPMKIQQEIADIMDHAYTEKQRLESEAKELLNSIDSYVMDKLGIEQTQQITPTNKWFTVKAEDLRGNRWDVASYEQIDNIVSLKYELTSLGEIVKDVFLGSTPAKNQYTNKKIGIPILKMKNMSKGFVDLTNLDYVDDTVYKPRFFLEKNMIFTASAAHTKEYLGKLWSVLLDTPKMNIACVAELNVIIPNSEKVNPVYLYNYLSLKKLYPKVNRLQRGQTAHLYPEDLKTVQILLPPLDIQKEIALECETRRNTAQQNQKLAQDILSKAKANVEKMLFGEDN